MVAANNPAVTVTLPSDREIAMTRVLDAPRHLVFDAWTKPEHLVHWFGPKGWTLVACEVDLRPGGAWRFVLHKDTGAKMGMTGVYREILRPERLVYTELYDHYDDMGPDVVPWPEASDGESVVTLTLQEAGGNTTFVSTSRYRSKQARDAVLQYPFEEGAATSFDRLAAHLTTMS